MERNIPKNKSGLGQTLETTRKERRKGIVALQKFSPLELSDHSKGAAGKSLDVLKIVANSRWALALSDLAITTQIPKTTLHRICSQLCELGFLLQDGGGRAFFAGPELRKLAFDTLNNGVLRGLRHQVLSGLSQQVSETCNLTTLDGIEVLYIDRVEARWPLRLTLEIGSRVPIHCTASGKLFLAMLPKKTSTQILSRITLEKLTNKTCVSKQALSEELNRIRVCGYSIDSEEFVSGLVALAVPIKNADGSVRAALSIHAPTSRMCLDRIMEWHQPLKDAAKALIELL
jgi:IclR family acetate operon transcriptional repressor